jgi:alginate O-acetyltransferase complex protein AlgI
MLFNSYTFWIFFAVVLLLYRFLPHQQQNRMLLGASWFFYGYWDWRFLILMIVSTTIDYFAAMAIERSEGSKRKVFLAVSVCSNLTILAIFKYSGFFIRELHNVLSQFGIQDSLPILRIVLPVGISFYTFQSIAYTVDVYRRQIPALRNYFDFALFVAFFPQLVAGPIQRASSLIPQLLTPRIQRKSDFTEGLYLIVSGLFRKVIIADNLASVANAIFNTDPKGLTGAECLVGVYAFAFQIYCDFSGYSQMAQGIAKWMGFDLVTNFRMPYFAVSPSDFWKRWHISLSSWLRDYLYVPLGGNRGSAWKTYRNLMVTMLLGGLWHGANWTFLVWGAFHGLLLCTYRLARGDAASDQPLDRPFTHAAKIVLMFHCVCFSWLLFRAESLGQVGIMLGQMLTNFHVTSYSLSLVAIVAFYAGPLMLFEYILERKGDLLWIVRSPVPARAIGYAYCVAMLFFFPPEIAHEFIYFQF